MAIYQIEWKRSALKDLKLIDRSIIPKILTCIELLAQNPRPPGVRKIQGSKNSFRIRVGDYRVIYEIRDTILMICVIRVRHRKSVYDV